MAGQMMGASKAQFFHEHVFCKEPGTQQQTPWHQDLPYYCVDGRQTASIYVALDAIPEEVSVRFVRGSHLWGTLFQPRTFLDGSEFTPHGERYAPTPNINADPDAYDIAVWQLDPGDCLVFNFQTLHGTTDGEVTSRRRAFSTRWMGDDVVYCHRPVETSPPYSELDLNPGDAMPADWFPVVWQR